MLLLIDVGNTNITIGINSNFKTIATFRLTTNQNVTEDELGNSIINLMKLNNIDYNNVSGSVISCVVPKMLLNLKRCVEKYFKVKPIVVGPGIKVGIKLNFENPKEAGADRIVNVVAASHLYQRDCLVIDFGTATTFDYISKDGVFEYTIITPGMETALKAIVSNAAKLPDIEIIKPKSILTKNTITGMQAGLVYGYIGQVEYIVNQIKKELKKDLYVICTGGLSKIIYENTDVIDIYEPNLAYIGMEIIYNRNN